MEQINSVDHQGDVWTFAITSSVLKGEGVGRGVSLSGEA